MKSLIGSLIGLVFVVSAAEPLLEGRVRLESGEPVADAQVRIFDLSDRRQGAIARALTDGTGYFALPLATHWGGGRCRRSSRWDRTIPIRSIPRRSFPINWRLRLRCGWRCSTCWGSTL